MTQTQLNEELEKGYADILAGRTRPASEVFASIRKDHGLWKITVQTDEVELKLDEADCTAFGDNVCFSEDTVFTNVRKRIHRREVL